MFRKGSPLARKNLLIDECHFDNTYNNNKHYSNFPSRRTAIELLIDLVSIKQAMDNNAIFEIKMNNLGKESLLLELSNHFDAAKIGVSQKRLKTFECVYNFRPECFITNPNKTTLFYVKGDFGKTPSFAQNRTIIHIDPTCLYFDAKKCNKKALFESFESDEENIYQIPYSDHCSYNDLLEFMRRLSFKRLYPLVNDPKLLHLTKLEALKKEVISERRQFSCKDCGVWWFRRGEEVSECSKKNCKQKYKPVPKEEEFGFCLYKCQCGHEFKLVFFLNVIKCSLKIFYFFFKIKEASGRKK